MYCYIYIYIYLFIVYKQTVLSLTLLVTSVSFVSLNNNKHISNIQNKKSSDALVKARKQVNFPNSNAWQKMTPSVMSLRGCEQRDHLILIFDISTNIIIIYI